MYAWILVFLLCSWKIETLFLKLNIKSYRLCSFKKNPHITSTSYLLSIIKKVLVLIWISSKIRINTYSLNRPCFLYFILNLCSSWTRIEETMTAVFEISSMAFLSSKMWLMGILTLIKWLLLNEDNGYYDLDISVKINIFTSLAKR